MTARGRGAKRMDSHHCTHLCTFRFGGLLIAQRHSRRHGSSRRTEREMWSGVAGCVRQRCGGIEEVTTFCFSIKKMRRDWKK